MHFTKGQTVAVQSFRFARRFFGDLVFMDHGSVDVSQDPNSNVEIFFLIILEAASSMILAFPMENKEAAAAQEAFREFCHYMQVMPKRVVADSAFQAESWEHFLRHKGHPICCFGSVYPVAKPR